MSGSILQIGNILAEWEIRQYLHGQGRYLRRYWRWSWGTFWLHASIDCCQGLQRVLHPLSRDIFWAVPLYLASSSPLTSPGRSVQNSYNSPIENAVTMHAIITCYEGNVHSWVLKEVLHLLKSCTKKLFARKFWVHILCIHVYVLLVPDVCFVCYGFLDFSYTHTIQIMCMSCYMYVVHIITRNGQREEKRKHSSRHAAR